MKYCDHNLRTVLDTSMTAFGRQSAKTPINLSEYYLLLNIFSDVNQGLEYLHSLEPPLIHRNLKPENILVVGHNPRGCFVKISGFGFSVFDESGSQSHTRGAGTEKYMAPEIGRGFQKKPHLDIKPEVRGTRRYRVYYDRPILWKATDKC
ncbi:unnamed protein product [Medioppia subpectinata]|uniref:Protein kinase domain-containing protein n=1 Tax=Medioppia subpectinata TaxID=1979941 RepID=A0A7R9KLG0_9ACAR|nr:unnamed protein product [Medioppia subpectinata]CAG2105764.1 unnamed protein product [Medioppia subpectinata]